MANKLIVNPIIWSPSEDRIHSSQMYKFMKAINKNYNTDLKTYDDLKEYIYEYLQQISDKKNSVWVNGKDFLQVI